jgi:hypothetical protein
VHPFWYLQSRVRTLAVLVIGLHELLGNPTVPSSKAGGHNNVDKLQMTKGYDK